VEESKETHVVREHPLDSSDIVLGVKVVWWKHIHHSA